MSRDGGGAQGAVVTHTYAHAGTYTAVVTASNPLSELLATTSVTVDEIITGLIATHDELTRPLRLTVQPRTSGKPIPPIKAEPAARASRLALCRLTADTLRLGLGLLGIPTLERM